MLLPAMESRLFYVAMKFYIEVIKVKVGYINIHLSFASAKLSGIKEVKRSYRPPRWARS